MTRYDQLFEAWRDAVGAVWPETIPNGIWDVKDAARIPYDAVNAQLVTPYATMDIARLAPTEAYGIANRAWEAQVRVYYILDADPATDPGLSERLELLADRLFATPLAFGQLIPRDVEIAEGDYMAAPNQLLLMLNATQRVGMVTATCIVSETPDRPAPVMRTIP